MVTAFESGSLLYGWALKKKNPVKETGVVPSAVISQDFFMEK